MRRLSLAILSLGLLGCVDPDFNTPELLKNPRILAIQAEPPQPSFGATTTLRSLIYQPKRDAGTAECVGDASTEPSYAWSWCPLPTSSSDGFNCPVDDNTFPWFFGMLAQSYPEMGQVAPSVLLGYGETATFRNPFPSRMLHDLCTGDVQIPAQFLAGLGLPISPDAGLEKIFSCDKPNYSDPNNQDPLGFRVTVKLEYTPPCWSPPQDNFGPKLTAVFTVHLPTDDSLPPNQNPVASQIFATFGFDPDAAVLSAPADDAGAPVPADAGVSDDAGTTAIDSSEIIDGGASIDGGEETGGGAVDAGEAVDGSGPSEDAAAATPDLAPAPSPDGSVPVGSVMFPRDKRVGLWVNVPLSSSEFLVRPGTIDEPDTKKKDVYHYERLGIVWFAEAGQFGAAHGQYGRHGGFSPLLNELERSPEDETNLETGRQTQWALPIFEDYKSPQARVVVVVRDSRGGVAWAEGVAPLEPTP